MKKEYLRPMIEIQTFCVSNVILASVDGEWDVESEWWINNPEIL